MVTSPDHEQISSEEITSDWCKIHFPRGLRVIYAETEPRPDVVNNVFERYKPPLEQSSTKPRADRSKGAWRWGVHLRVANQKSIKQRKMKAQDATQRSRILPVRGVPVGESPEDHGSFLRLYCSSPADKGPRLPAVLGASSCDDGLLGGRNLAEKAEAYFCASAASSALAASLLQRRSNAPICCLATSSSTAFTWTQGEEEKGVPDCR